MKREIYVFFDSVAQNFGEPFTMANSSEMRRQFEQIVANPAIPAYAIADTCVVHLGEFVPDPDNPHIVPDAIPYVELRGGNYNVEERRRQNSACTATASELPSV